MHLIIGRKQDEKFVEIFIRHHTKVQPEPGLIVLEVLPSSSGADSACATWKRHYGLAQQNRRPYKFKRTGLFMPVQQFLEQLELHSTKKKEKHHRKLVALGATRLYPDDGSNGFITWMPGTDTWIPLVTHNSV